MQRIRIVLGIVVLLATVVGLFAITPATQAAAPTCAQTYVVQPGDNLFRIGLRFGYTVTSLQALNGLPNPNWIFAGQRLCVSGAPAPIPQPPTPQPGFRTYTVQWGDTLASIGWRYGYTAPELANFNRIANPNFIYAGQVIRLPWAF